MKESDGLAARWWWWPPQVRRLWSAPPFRVELEDEDAIEEDDVD